MKKDLDISRPRYSEQTLPVRPLTLRYVEVLQLYLNWQTWHPRRAYPPAPPPPPPPHTPPSPLALCFTGIESYTKREKKEGFEAKSGDRIRDLPHRRHRKRVSKKGGSSDGWRLRFSNFDGWRLNFVAFYGWRLSSWNYSISYSKY